MIDVQSKDWGRSALLVAVFAAAFVGGIGPQGLVQEAEATPLYAVGRSDATLRVIDHTTGEVTSSVTMFLSGKTINGATGLAWDGSTLWGLLKLSRQSTRELVTINPISGVVTSIGDTGVSDAGLRFSGLDFDSSGTLYGVTGDGSNSPETLRVLNQTNASSTHHISLGNGNDGETIAFNSDDGLMYHGSGAPTDNVVFETVDLISGATSNIFTGAPLSGFNEFNALTYAGGDLFYASSIFDALFTVTSTGTMASLDILRDVEITGLAFAAPVLVLVNVPEPATLVLFGVGLAGLGFTGRKIR